MENNIKNNFLDKHQSMFLFLNSDSQFPNYCLQEINWILYKRRPWINAALKSWKLLLNATLFDWINTVLNTK